MANSTTTRVLRKIFLQNKPAIELPKSDNPGDKVSPTSQKQTKERRKRKQLADLPGSDSDKSKKTKKRSDSEIVTRVCCAGILKYYLSNYLTEKSFGSSEHLGKIKIYNLTYSYKEPAKKFTSLEKQIPSEASFEIARLDNSLSYPTGNIIDCLTFISNDGQIYVQLWLENFFGGFQVWEFDANNFSQALNGLSLAITQVQYADLPATRARENHSLRQQVREILLMILQHSGKEKLVQVLESQSIHSLQALEKSLQRYQWNTLDENTKNLIQTYSIEQLYGFLQNPQLLCQNCGLTNTLENQQRLVNYITYRILELEVNSTIVNRQVAAKQLLDPYFAALENETGKNELAETLSAIVSPVIIFVEKGNSQELTEHLSQQKAKESTALTLVAYQKSDGTRDYYWYSCDGQSSTYDPNSETKAWLDSKGPADSIISDDIFPNATTETDQQVDFANSSDASISALTECLVDAAIQIVESSKRVVAPESNGQFFPQSKESVDMTDETPEGHAAPTKFSP
ncbi:MAG: hypothetical protein AAGG80_04480 [Pseudomonadota bacterium]